MKWVGIILVAIFLGIVSVALFQTKGDLSRAVYASACETPVTYTIDSIDARFGLSRTEAQKNIEEAADIWEKEYGGNLFENKTSEKAEIAISFVYDQRQELDSQIRDLQKNLDSQNADLQNKLAEYKKDVDRFREKINALNEEIKSWNAKGGAHAETFDRLVTEQKALKTQGDEINARARDLNLSTENYNTEVGLLNNDVSNFNKVLSQKPEEGLYDPNLDTITIYFVNDHNELVHTLAHEFGHSLKMQHVVDQTGIMHPNTNSSISLSEDDRNQLSEVCREQLIFNLWAEELTEFVRKNFVKAPNN